MNDQPYQEIAVFNSEVVALDAQAYLLDHSIEARLGGMEGSALGVSLEGGDLIKISVPIDKIEEAVRLLEELTASESEESVVPAWTCHQCGEEVDEGFAICWNCGAEYPH